MAMKRRSPEQLTRWAKAIRNNNGNVAAAARELGEVTETLRAAKEDLAPYIANLPAPDELSLPEFPDDDIPTAEIIATLAKRHRRKRESFAAHTWFKVKAKDNKPIGIVWFGDPHVDDNGCDWDLLQSHTDLCRDTPGLYGANIGDTTNNWAGRLTRLYANQDTSVATARKLARWLMVESGVSWLIFLIGNHDAWGDGAEILAQMSAKYGTKKIVHDWEARFALTFPNGWEPRVYAAHNFPGNSMWNPLHGPMKVGQMGEDADLYVCGDKHNWAEFSFDNPARKRVQHFLRVRGYKFMDEYARHHGKLEQETGASIMTVFDPTDRSIMRFANLEKGAAFLTMLRGRT